MKNQTGVSLIESLLVIVVVSGIVFLMANLPNAMGLINKSKHLSLAREIASKQIEDKRSTSYSNLVSDPSPQPFSDSRLNLLPKPSANSSAGTILIEDCDSVKICTNGEHVKKITVTVNWTDNQKPQTIFLITFIGEGGLNQ